MPPMLPPTPPHVRAHPEVLRAFDALGAGRINADVAFTSLCATVSEYLWPSASEWHGYIVGRLIAHALRNTIEWIDTPPTTVHGNLASLWRCAENDPPSDCAAARGVWVMTFLTWPYFGSDEPGQKGVRRICSEKLDTLFPGARYPFDDSLVSPFEEELAWPEFRHRMREFYCYADEP